MRRLAGAGLLALLPSLVSAGAWGRPKGSFYLKTGYNYLPAEELATPEGEVVDIPRFTKNEGTFHLAYGVSSRLTAVLDMVVYRQSEIEGFDSAGGMGDTRVGLQCRLGSRGRGVFSLRGTLQVPTGDETKGLSVLPTGSGVWEGDIIVSAGSSLWGGRGWGQVAAGPYFRGGELRDGLSYGGQLGVRVWRRLLLMFNVRGVQPWNTEPGDLSTQSAAGFGDGVTYLAFGPGLAVELGGGVGVQLDLDGATNVRNIAKGTTLRVGLYVAR